MSFEESIKGFILKLLDDEQIQQRLVSLSGEVQNVAQANKKEISDKQNRIAQLEDETRGKQDRIHQLEDETREKQDRISRLEKTVNDKQWRIGELEARVRDLENIQVNFSMFVEIDNIFQKYCSLPEEIQKSLDDLICRYSPVTFLLSGSANDNIPL